MKMKKVEIEIPEDMAVSKVRPYGQVSGPSLNMLVVELTTRTPRKLVFEEVIGKTRVEKGDYWSDVRYPTDIVQATASYDLDEGVIAWRLT